MLNVNVIGPSVHIVQWRWERGGDFTAQQFSFYSSIDTAKKTCQCLLMSNIGGKSCTSTYPKMEEIGEIEVVYVNESLVKDESDIIFSNVKYQYKTIVNAPMHWPGKIILTDVNHSSDDDSASKVFVCYYNYFSLVSNWMFAILRQFLLFAFVNFCFSDGIKIKSDSRYNPHCGHCYCHDYWNIGYNQVGLLRSII